MHNHAGTPWMTTQGCKIQVVYRVSRIDWKSVLGGFSTRGTRCRYPFMHNHAGTPWMTTGESSTGIDSTGRDVYRERFYREPTLQGSILQGESSTGIDSTGIDSTENRLYRERFYRDRFYRESRLQGTILHGKSSTGRGDIIPFFKGKAFFFDKNLFFSFFLFFRGKPFFLNLWKYDKIHLKTIDLVIVSMKNRSTPQARYRSPSVIHLFLMFYWFLIKFYYEIIKSSFKKEQLCEKRLKFLLKFEKFLTITFRRPFFAPRSEKFMITPFSTKNLTIFCVPFKKPFFLVKTLLKPFFLGWKW
jgi:hypothetical protein